MVAPSQLPKGLSFDSTTGELTGEPTTVGKTFFQINATANGITTSQTFDINVVDGPQSEPISSIQFDSSPLLTATVGVEYSYNVEYSVIESVSPELTAIIIPAWLNLEGNNLFGTPAPKDVGNHVVRLRVNTPDGGEAEQSFVIVVSEAPVEITQITFTLDNEGNVRMSRPDDLRKKYVYELYIKFSDSLGDDEITKLYEFLTKPTFGDNWRYTSGDTEKRKYIFTNIFRNAKSI